MLNFDELNSLTRLTYEENKYNKEKLEDDLFDLLILAYESGFLEVRNSVDYTDNELNLDKLNTALNASYDGKTIRDLLNEHIDKDDINGVLKVMNTESNRLYNAGAYDNAQEINEYVPLKKKWNTMLDDKVRDTHVYLENVDVPMDEKFYTFDGDSAYYPCGFEKAENNVSCRCYVTYSRL